MIDSQTTLDVARRLQLARIGRYDTWQRMIKKLEGGAPLNPAEMEYYARMTRIYGNPAPRSRMYHTRLSEHDEKPPCDSCGEDSAYYCGINDRYFCQAHIVGHDRNEI